MHPDDLVQTRRRHTEGLLKRLHQQAQRQQVYLSVPDIRYTHPPISAHRLAGGASLILCSRVHITSLPRDRMLAILDFVKSCIYGNMCLSGPEAPAFRARLATWYDGLVASVGSTTVCRPVAEVFRQVTETPGYPTTSQAG
jgi:hypothetical protein